MGKMSELDEEIRQQKEASGRNWKYRPEVVGKSDCGEELTEEILSSDDYYQLWKQKHGLDEDEAEEKKSQPADEANDEIENEQI